MNLITEQDMSLNHITSLMPSFEREKKKPPESKTKTLHKMLSLKKTQELKKNKQIMKQMLHKAKTKKICDRFIKIMKRLTMFNRPPECQLTNLQLRDANLWERFKGTLDETQGLQVSYLVTVVWALLNSLQTIAVVFIASIMLVFSETKANIFFQSLLYISWLLHLIDIVLNCTVQRPHNSKKLQTLKQIIAQYLKNDLKLDIIYFLSLAILPISIHISVDLSIQVIMFIKMFNSISRFDQFEHHLFLRNLELEKYYQVVKVVLLNFMIAHIIAIVLLLMPKIREQNWVQKHQLQGVDWTQRYIWGYYWGVTIMLTVGFGDFAATNKQEALLLVFIQTFSCILLAYNINTVGIILNQIRLKQRQRNKKVKIFTKMSEEDNIPSKVSNQIINFIDRSFKIKDQFQYQQYQDIIQSLPTLMKSDYKKQTTKQIFTSMPLIKFLSKKSMLSLAERIHKKIAHPQQIIHRRGQPFIFTILKKGKLALCLKRNNLLDGTIVHTLSSDNPLNAKLLSLRFLKGGVCQYDVKSLDFSVIYQLGVSDFIDTIRDKPYDYQFLCEIKDKDQAYLQNYQLNQCVQCPSEKHDFFNCPKIHYVPLRTHIIQKYLKNGLNKNQRRKFARKKQNINVLSYFIIVQCQFQIFTQKTIQQSMPQPKKTPSSKMIKNYIRKSCQKRSKDYQGSLQKQRLFKKLSISSDYVQMRPKDTNISFKQDQNDSQNCSYQFWDMQCDIGYNFNHYFQRNNMEYIGRNAEEKVVFRSTRNIT